MRWPPPEATLFPYTTLFRSSSTGRSGSPALAAIMNCAVSKPLADQRSEEHTSELQSRFDLVCRLLAEKETLASKLIKSTARAKKVTENSTQRARQKEAVTMQ